MKKTVFTILFVFLCVSCLLIACDKKESMDQTDASALAGGKSLSASDLVSLEDKASYGMGYDMGKKFKELGFDISADIFSKGLFSADFLIVRFDVNVPLPMGFYFS